MKIAKLLTISFISICIIAVSCGYSVTAKDGQSIEGPEVTEYFTTFDENGNTKVVNYDDIEKDQSKVDELKNEYNLVVKTSDGEKVVETFDTKEEAQNSLAAKKKGRSALSYSVEESTRAITYGVLQLHEEAYALNSYGKHNQYLTYKNVSTPGATGYTTGAYGKDAAYIGTFNGKIRGIQSGVIMDFEPEDVDIIDYSVANISYYYISNGALYHKIYYGTSSSTAYKVGFSLKFMSEGKKYYSYDGHYFYSSYTTMIDDYKASRRSSSINASNPYYNYYQFLSHRSLSLFNASTFNSIVVDKIGDSASKMKSLGQYYIDYQNEYGINSLLMFGVSGNESAWGTSDIAKDKNNLFGHGAGDNDPYYGADGYVSASDSIRNHAKTFLSSGYLDNEDWRYQGGYLGDKLSGINVRYASDPYWGEKAAAVYYSYSTLNDFGRYSIGIINGNVKSYNLYKEPSTSSAVSHVLGKGSSPVVTDLAVIILETVTDGSGKKWYKIQSDTTLNSGRTDTDWDGIYNFSRDYLYIPASGVTITNQSSSNVSVYIRGDVNGDGRVNALDYVQIENHIMERKILDGDKLIRADVDYNGKINALDYVKIENHIMDRSKLS